MTSATRLDSVELTKATPPRVQEDFPAEVAGNIAFISRGECTFLQKSTLAGAAGSIGAVVFNNVDGIVQGTLGEPPVGGTLVAIVGMSKADGDVLAARITAGETVMASLAVESIIDRVYT